jgi:Effector Associated Constant Component 1
MLDVGLVRGHASAMEVLLTTEAAGAVPEQLARVAASLREDLLAFGVVGADNPPAKEPPPPGARGSALEWAQLVVTLAGSLPALAGFVRGWVRDHRGVGDHRDVRVRIEIDGDAIELDGATDAESRQLLEAFLARHPE